MTLEDDRLRVIEVFTNARPRAVSAEVSYLRAGPKGADLGKIGHSAEQPLPLPDALDKRVARLHRSYKRAITACARFADEIERAERELLTRLHDGGAATEEARALARGEDEEECSNCFAVVERLFKGRCRSCHEYQKLHDGAERPRVLIDKEVFG